MTKVRHYFPTNVATQIISGKADIIMVGDSLGTRATYDRIIVSIIQRWKPDQWRGQFATTIAWNNSGIGEPALISNNIAGSGSTSQQVRMGEDLPGTAPRGLNLRPFTSFAFAADFSNFYQYLCQFRMPNTDPTLRYNPNFYYDWLRNVDARIGILFVSSDDSVGANNSQLPKIAGYNRAGVRDAAGITAIDPNANPGTLQYAETGLFALGTGTANANSAQGEMQFYAENETGLRFHPVQFRIHCPNMATGLSVNYAAQGGATVKSHLPAGDTITADSVTFLSGYTDAALLAECTYCGYDIAWIMLGTNSAASTVAEYIADIEAVGDRYLAAMVAAGRTNPEIILESPHPTDASGRFESYAIALEGLARRRGWTLIDTYGESMREFGSVPGVIAALTAQGYGPIPGTTDTDAIHYSVWGAEWRATKTWSVLCAARSGQPLKYGVGGRAGGIGIGI